MNNQTKKDEDLSLENIYQFPSLYTAETQFKIDIENIHKNTLNLNYGKIKEEIETEAFAQKFAGFGIKREHKDIDEANTKLFKMLLKSSYKEAKVNVFYQDYDDLDDWYDNKKNTIESITKRPYDPYMQGYCEECEKFERGDYDMKLEDEEVIEETMFNDQEYFSKTFSSDIA
jgi:DNA gyrase inhibitor GyrI